MEEFDRLVEIMARLRGPGGCPWDREQTHQSLKRYFLEEVYEALDAIDAGDWGRLAEELGDVILQVVFHAQLAREAGRFDIRDSLRLICEKLVRRHPHVFGNVKVSGPEEVLDNWEHIKRAERAPDGRASVLDGVPKAMPALLRAMTIQKKAARIGFDWPDVSGVWEKVAEELRELREAAEAGDEARVREELGDLLFSVVNLARFLQVDAEDALQAATRRFEERFRRMEAQAAERGLDMREMSLEELDELWEEAKQQGG